MTPADTCKLNKIYKVKNGMAKEYLNTSIHAWSGMIREIFVLRSASHPNIIKLLDIQSSKVGLPIIIMEYGGITLWEYGKTMSQHFRMMQFESIFSQIFNAVDYLHKNHIIHRDLKGTNVLVNGPFVKICDFGTTRRLSGDMTPDVCTIDYKAPELLIVHDNINCYESSTDIWSMACLMFEYVQHEVMFEGNTDVKVWNEIMKCLPVGAPNPWTKSGIPGPSGSWKRLDEMFDKSKYGLVLHPVLPSLSQLMKSMLSLVAEMRPTSEQCLVSIKMAFSQPLPVLPINGYHIKPTYLVRKTTHVDLDIRHVIVANMLSMENYYDLSRKSIARSVDIFDRWLMQTDGSEDLILYSLAASILASYGEIIIPVVEFASVYSEEIITEAMKVLFRMVDYNIDYLDMWSIMLDIVRERNLPQQEYLDIYWHRVCELLLDYNMLFAKSEESIRTILDRVVV